MPDKKRDPEIEALQSVHAALKPLSADERTRVLILIKEEGVGSIGGIQGDYEFIEFDRDRLEELSVKLIQVFDVNATGLRR